MKGFGEIRSNGPSSRDLCVSERFTTCLDPHAGLDARIAGGPLRHAGAFCRRCVPLPRSSPACTAKLEHALARCALARCCQRRQYAHIVLYN